MKAPRPAPPSAAAVAELLGPAQKLWDRIREGVGHLATPLTEDWVFSGAKHGWALRIKHRQRAVLYLKPLERHFRVSLAFGPDAVKSAHERKLPASVLRLIDEAPQYPEGKAVRIEVRGPADVEVALQLATIKLER